MRLAFLTYLLYHSIAKPVTNFIKRVAILTNIGYNPEASQGDHTITKYEMPNLMGLSVRDCEEMLKQDYGFVPVEVGGGLTVVGQYPKEGEAVYTDAKVYLLTDGNTVSLPDFTGWSRKELVNYWTISGVPITIDGYGVVYDQSIPAGSSVDKNSEVIVFLKSIETNIDVSSRIDSEEE